MPCVMVQNVQLRHIYKEDSEVYGFGEADETPVDAAIASRPHATLLYPDGYKITPPRSSDSTEWVIWCDGEIIGLAQDFMSADNFVRTLLGGELWTQSIQ